MQGAAGVVHARDLADDIDRVVTTVDVTAPAIVLGSAQPASDVDVDAAARLGVEIVRRRSGGGAVLLDPGDPVWIDVEIGRGDPLWDDDVSRSMLWLGAVWVEALARLGRDGAVVHDGAMRRPPLARVVCFAGLAPGEVTLDGAKVVGISQRRTRAGARFQCAVPRHWSIDRLAELLAPGLAATATTGRAGSIAVASVVAPVDDIVDAFLSSLP